MADDSFDSLLALTADIVAAHVGNNNVSVGDVPTLIHNVHTALTALGTPVSEPVVEQQPEFQGGYEAMINFIKKNLRYPASARRMGVDGTV